MRFTSQRMQVAAMVVGGLLLPAPVLAAEPADKGDKAYGVQVVRDEHGAKVLVDGELFTHYLVDAGPKPYCWPVRSATGKDVTRAYPMKDVSGEKHDHRHHRSWWFTHGDVNGVDFWSEAGDHGTIVHRKFLALESGLQVGRLRTLNDWLAPDGTKVCQDERELRIYHRSDARVVDFDVTVRAGAEPATFGDTKEGMMGVRVATSMDVNSEPGGHIVNSRGQRDGDAWGRQAEWVDYYGPVDGETLGVAILNHPDSFRAPTHWHVRTYGLFAANPFGLHDFLRSSDVNGSHTLQPGESMTFRYRLYIHSGDTQEARVAEEYAKYAAGD